MQAPPASTEQSIPPASAGHSAPGLYTIPVLALALLLRLLVLGVILTQYPANWIYSRGIEMGLLAKSILAGQGLSSPFGGSTGPTAFIAPIYPILIAGVFRIFGVESFASSIVIITAQILLNLLTVWLMMRIARQLFDVQTANLAGVFWACSLPLIWIPTIFWETSISICLLVGLIAVVLRCRQNPTPGIWVFGGAYCGFAGLVNPALIPTFGAIAVLTAYWTRKKARLAPALGLLVSVLIFAPWPIRNARVFHAFIPTRTTVGFELWMGNYPGASGYLEESLFPMYNSRELTDYKSLGEIAYTNNKSQVALQSVHQYPQQFLRLTVLRILRFWTGTGTRGGSFIFLLHALTTTVFGLGGLWLLFRQRRMDVAMLFLLPLLVFPLPYYITHAEFRYRLIIDPLLTVLAAYALTQLGLDRKQKAITE